MTLGFKKIDENYVFEGDYFKILSKGRDMIDNEVKVLNMTPEER